MKIKTLILFLLATFLTLGLLAGCNPTINETIPPTTPKPKTPEMVYDEAVREYEKGNLKEAVLLFEEALELFENTYSLAELQEENTSLKGKYNANSSFVVFINGINSFLNNEWKEAYDLFTNTYRIPYEIDFKAVSELLTYVTYARYRNDDGHYRFEENLELNCYYNLLNDYIEDQVANGKREINVRNFINEMNMDISDFNNETGNLVNRITSNLKEKINNSGFNDDSFLINGSFTNHVTVTGEKLFISRKLSSLGNAIESTFIYIPLNYFAREMEEVRYILVTSNVSHNYYCTYDNKTKGYSTSETISLIDVINGEILITEEFYAVPPDYVTINVRQDTYGIVGDSEISDRFKPFFQTLFPIITFDN